MTKEIQNEIIGMFWAQMPMILLFIFAGAILGIGYKIIEIKLLKKLKEKKENKEENKQK